MRSLEIGDESVILLPTDSNKSLMQCKGPDEVVENVRLNHYRIKIGDNNKLFHINMMKSYYERSDDDVVGLKSIIEDQPERETVEDFSSNGREVGIGMSMEMANYRSLRSETCYC